MGETETLDILIARLMDLREQVGGDTEVWTVDDERGHVKHYGAYVTEVVEVFNGWTNEIVYGDLQDWDPRGTGEGILSEPKTVVMV